MVLRHDFYSQLLLSILMGERVIRSVQKEVKNSFILIDGAKYAFYDMRLIRERRNRFSQRGSKGGMPIPKKLFPIDQTTNLATCRQQPQNDKLINTNSLPKSTLRDINRASPNRVKILARRPCHHHNSVIPLHRHPQLDNHIHQTANLVVLLVRRTGLPSRHSNA